MLFVIFNNPENKKLHFGFSGFVYYLCGVVGRSLFDEITKLAKQFPAVAILGPRQIGKTTLAKLLSKKLDKKTVFLDLGKPSDRLKL